MSRSHSLAEKSSGQPAAAERALPAPRALNLITSDVGNLALQDLVSGGLRPKLKVGGASDPEEREADALADAVTNGRGPAACACGSCPKCAGNNGSDVIRRKDHANGVLGRDGVGRAFHGSGRPLDAATRSHFEARFGADLSRIRLHDDRRTASMAATIGARAFAVGNEIGFAKGEFSPNTKAGRALLTHELAHIVLGHGGVRREAALPPPVAPLGLAPPGEPQACYAPKGPTLEFEGVLLAGNSEYLDSVLREYIAKHGEDGARDFQQRLRKHVGEKIQRDEDLDVEDPVALVTNDPASQNVPPHAKIVVAVDQVLAKIIKSNHEWLISFEKQAHDVVLGMLAESEQRVKEELVRYGISWELVQRHVYRQGRGGLMSTTYTTTEYAMQDTPASEALGEAATGLLNRKHKLDEANAELQKYFDDTGGGWAELSRTRTFAGQQTKEQLHLEELRGVSAKAERDLDVFTMQKTAEFPILAAYARKGEINEEALEKVEKLAKDKSNPAAYLLGGEIKSRLEHIKEVREDIVEHGGEETKIWRVPRIIEGTRGALGVKPGTMYARLIDDKVKEEAPGLLSSILIGLLQLVLVLLAPATGGLSLIGAGAISAYQAYHSFREYERAQMLRGTDFGPLALSSEDPSLFWLAVDIVGAVADVGAAAGATLRVFRSLAPAAHAVEGARTAEAAEQAARDLERAGQAAGESLGKPRAASEAFGKALAKEALEHNKGLGAIGESAEEANALERATERMAATQEVKAGVRETSVAGHEVVVSKSGGLWACSAPCTLLRERYKGLLQSSDAWQNTVKDLEKEAAAITAKETAGEISSEAAKAAREGVASRAAALEREMRSSPIGIAFHTSQVEALAKGRPQLAKELERAKSLVGSEAEQAMTDLMSRAERIERAENMSLEELEAMLNDEAFGVDTISGVDLRYVRYTKQGGALPFEQWESTAQRIWENTRFGSLRERELKQAYDLTPKNVAKMQNPASKGVNFVPDHVIGHPAALEWGKPYHFEEIKDWAKMSDTGNLSAMLDYVRDVPGAKLTIYFKSNTYMSGPLRTRIEGLMKSGKVELIPFIGE